MEESVKHIQNLEKTDANRSLLLLFKSYCLWLEDPSVQNCATHIPRMGARFNTRKLAAIVSGCRVCQSFL